MKIIAALLLMLAASQPVLAAETNLAPADRYFGQMKMSILGVRNSLADLTRAAAADPTSADRIIHKAEFVEEALHDWKVKFPHDPWLPKYAHSLVALYQACEGDDAKRHGHAAQDWLNENFPESQYAEAY